MGPQVIVPSGEEIREVDGVWQEALKAEYLLWLPRKEISVPDLQVPLVCFWNGAAQDWAICLDTMPFCALLSDLSFLTGEGCLP